MLRGHTCAEEGRAIGRSFGFRDKKGNVAEFDFYAMLRGHKSAQMKDIYKARSDLAAARSCISNANSSAEYKSKYLHRALIFCRPYLPHVDAFIRQEANALTAKANQMILDLPSK